jgi:hypothetical protein
MILEGKTIVYKEYKNVEPTKEEKEIIKNYGIFFYNTVQSVTRNTGIIVDIVGVTDGDTFVIVLSNNLLHCISFDRIIKITKNAEKEYF